MPVFVSELSVEYSGAAGRLSQASADAWSANDSLAGYSIWTSVAAWLFRGSISRRLEVIDEGSSVLTQAAQVLLELERDVNNAESQMASAQVTIAQARNSNPFAPITPYAITPGVAELSVATSRRDEAYRRAADALWKLAMTAPAVEQGMEDYVEGQLRKDGIKIQVTVQDGEVIEADWDGLHGKKMWKVMGLTDYGRKAQADLKAEAGYNDGLGSLKTWSPFHAGERIAIAYMDGDELRMGLEVIGALPIPGAGALVKVGSKGVTKLVAKTTAKVVAKKAAREATENLAKKASKEVSKKVTTESAEALAGKSTSALVDPGKYDYLFGRVSSGSHNAARSAQNARQLARVGVHDTTAGRSLLQQHFDTVVRRRGNVLKQFSTEYGTFQIRESLFAGPGGFLKLESTWQVTKDGLRLTTVIPMGAA